MALFIRWDDARIKEGILYMKKLIGGTTKKLAYDLLKNFLKELSWFKKYGKSYH